MFWICVIIPALILGYFILTIPMRIARAKDLSIRRAKLIFILQWLGLFNGITWLIALVLAFLYSDDDDRLNPF